MYTSYFSPQLPAVSNAAVLLITHQCLLNQPENYTFLCWCVLGHTVLNNQRKGNLLCNEKRRSHLAEPHNTTVMLEQCRRARCSQLWTGRVGCHQKLVSAHLYRAAAALSHLCSQCKGLCWVLWGVERSSFLSEHSVKGRSWFAGWDMALCSATGERLPAPRNLYPCFCLLGFSFCFFFFSNPHWSACALLKLKHVCSSGNI